MLCIPGLRSTALMRLRVVTLGLNTSKRNQIDRPGPPPTTSCNVRAAVPPLLRVRALLSLEDVYRPRLRPNTGQVLVQGARARKHGVAVVGKPRVTARHAPQNTCWRHKPPLPLHDYKRGVEQPNTHPRTQGHMESQLHQHFATR